MDSAGNMNGHRLPDFILIGCRKCGTTSLASWLGNCPEIHFSQPKEPDFFSEERVWTRGLEWYAGLFNAARPWQLTGEGSTSYTHPRWAEVAADRIARVLPHVKLIYLLRHPVERVRSHFRHRAMYQDEHRPLVEALRDPSTNYLSQSMYFRCLKPFTERYARDRILVVRLEDVQDPQGPGWAQALQHLGVPFRPHEASRENVSGSRGMYRSVLPRLEKSRLRPLASAFPAPVLRALRRVFTSNGREFARRMEASKAPIPEELLGPIWEDISRLETWLGRTKPLWGRP